MHRHPRRSDARLRLFVAAYPPPAVAGALLREANGLLPGGARPVPLEQVHLTLQFIGDTPVRELDHVRESVLRAAAGLRTFTLTPLRLITLPRRGPIRVLAAETDAPAALMELKRRLAARFAHRPRHDPAEEFVPHLTLARLSPPRALDHVESSIVAPGFIVDEVNLVRSSLLATGAVHHEVLSAPLEPGRESP